MKRTVQFLTVIAMICIAVSSLSAGGSQSGGAVEMSFALRKHPDDTLDTSLPYWKFLEDKLKIKLNLIPLPEEGWPEKRNVLLASGETYDLISTESSIANLYGDEGVFDEVGPLIEKYASKDSILRDLLDVAGTYNLRDDDNRLFGIPRWYEFYTLEDRGIVYRKDILDSLGLREPATMDEWYEAFKAVKAKYPDMIPLTCNVFQVYAGDVFLPYWDMEDISGGWGFIGSRRSEGQIVYLPATDNYRRLLEYWAKLYREGLLDREYVTINYDQWVERLSNGRVFANLTSGYRADWSTQIAKEAGNNFAYTLATPPLNSAGKRELYRNLSPWLGDLMTSVFSSSKHKAEAMKLIDYLYTTEGSKQNAYGVEGLTCTVKDGVWVKNWPSAEFNEQRQKIGFGQHLPHLTTIADEGMYDSSTPNQLKTVEVYKPLSVDIPHIKISAAADDALRDIRANLGTYRDTLFNEVVLGRRTTDNWNAIVGDMERLGSKQVTEIVQQAYNEYAAAGKR
jgi:putative aldouronate transport system substrate-binding protein